MDMVNCKAEALSFGDADVMQYLKGVLLRHVESTGLNPFVTAEWKEGIFRLFGIQTVNLPDLNDGNYILASNHISDIDALILGLLYPRIRIVSKIGWADNRELMNFLQLHYNITGIYRESDIEKLDEESKKIAKAHNFQLFRDITNYLKEPGDPHHLLIFPQGTISDINKNSIERVNPGFAKIASATRAKVVNVFIEYPKGGGITRIVCGNPYTVSNRRDGHSQAWLEDVLSLQNQLENVRTPVLSEKHTLNNNPGEPFF